jgi:hypothetical protein
VPTHVPDDASEPRRRVRTRISPEQGRRLFREYVEAPVGAKLPDGWHLNQNRVSIPCVGFTTRKRSGQGEDSEKVIVPKEQFRIKCDP